MSSLRPAAPTVDAAVVREVKTKVVERLVGFVSTAAIDVALRDVDVAYETHPELLALELIPAAAGSDGRQGVRVAPVLLPAQLAALEARTAAMLHEAMALVDEGTAGSRSRAELHAQGSRTT